MLLVKSVGPVGYSDKKSESFTDYMEIVVILILIFIFENIHWDIQAVIFLVQLLLFWQRQTYF